MFSYNGVEVTKENYKEVFSELSIDTLDEIRLAILDNTEIGDVVNSAEDDSYKLGQLRISIREDVPPRFRGTTLSGRVLKKFRECYISGLDLEVLGMYVSPMGTLSISEESMFNLASTYLLGVDVKCINFNTISEDLVPTLCEGLKQGYPMWLYVGADTDISKEKLKVILNGMKQGFDMLVFRHKDWDVSSILTLLGAGAFACNVCLSYVTSEFTLKQVTFIVNAVCECLDVSVLASQDINGKPVFNEGQMWEILSALREGLPLDTIAIADKRPVDMSKERLRLKK